MSEKQLNTNSNSQSNDIMKCLYLGLALRHRVDASYIYSLVVMRDKKGTYSTTPQLNIEMFKNKEDANLAYETKKQILETQDCFVRKIDVVGVNTYAENMLKNFYNFQKGCTKYCR